MTQKEIIEFEETNTGVIRLYLEGSFYKAYERSPQKPLQAVGRHPGDGANLLSKGENC